MSGWWELLWIMIFLYLCSFHPPKKQLPAQRYKQILPLDHLDMYVYLESKWPIIWKIWPIKWKVSPPKKEVSWVLGLYIYIYLFIYLIIYLSIYLHHLPGSFCLTVLPKRKKSRPENFGFHEAARFGGHPSRMTYKTLKLTASLPLKIGLLGP